MRVVKAWQLGALSAAAAAGALGAPLNFIKSLEGAPSYAIKKQIKTLGRAAAGLRPQRANRVQKLNKKEKDMVQLVRQQIIKNK